MGILRLTSLLLAVTMCSFLKTGKFVDDSVHQTSVLVTEPSLEFRFNGDKLGNTMDILTNELQIIYEEQNKPLEGKELYLSMINYIGETYYPSLDRAIVQAVMETESNYNPNVGNPSGAIGLMQIIPKWHIHRAEKYGLDDLWKPYTNILVGMDSLNESYQKYGNYQEALYVYNHSWTYVNHVICLADEIRGGD